MQRLTCDAVRDRLPELARGEVDQDEAHRLRNHLHGCGECAGVWEIVRLVNSAPPVRAPEGLEERMARAARGALKERRGGGSGAGADTGPSRRRRVPSWGLAAAAGVVLALGTPLLIQRMQAPMAGSMDSASVAGDAVAMEVQELLPSAYVSDDPVVAGAPVFDGLSDEALVALLEEMGG